jgi:hypothetical protein
MAPLAEISPRKEKPSLRMEGLVALEEMMSIMLFLGGWATGVVSAGIPVEEGTAGGFS